VLEAAGATRRAHKALDSVNFGKGVPADAKIERAIKRRSGRVIGAASGGRLFQVEWQQQADIGSAV
jgi:hypothetical protein